MKLKQNLATRVALTSAVVVGLAGVASPALAALSQTDTASATIVTPIAIAAPTTSLNFGSIDASGLASGTATVTVDANPGAATPVTYGSGLASTSLVTPSVGTFAVSGNAGAGYSVVITGPASNVLTSGTNTMGVAFTYYSANASSYSAPTLNGTTGADTLTVGGTLTVSSGQAAGTYTGTYTVAVAYN